MHCIFENYVILDYSTNVSSSKIHRKYENPCGNGNLALSFSFYKLFWRLVLIIVINTNIPKKILNFNDANLRWKPLYTATTAICGTYLEKETNSSLPILSSSRTRLERENVCACICVCVCVCVFVCVCEREREKRRECVCT